MYLMTVSQCHENDSSYSQDTQQLVIKMVGSRELNRSRGFPLHAVRVLSTTAKIWRNFSQRYSTYEHGVVS